MFGEEEPEIIEFSTKLTKVESLFMYPTLNVAPQARIN